MFEWLKRMQRAAGVASTSVAAVVRWKWAFIAASSRSGPRHYDPDFWDEAVRQFCVQWRRVEPASKDPERLLEKRLGVYLSFLKDTVLKEARNCGLTPSELEEVGEFIARASVHDLHDAILSQPAAVSPIFDMLPSAWLESAGVTREQFEHCYFQSTGKRRPSLPPRISSENDVGCVTAAKIYEYGSLLTEQDREQFVGDFHDKMKKGVEEYLSKAVPPPIPCPSDSEAPQKRTDKGQTIKRYVACPCEHCDGGIEFDANQLAQGEVRAVQCPHCLMQTKIFASGPTEPPVIPPVNDCERVKIYLRDAEKGNADAQCQLGYCYYNGEGVPQNYDQAMKWFLEAARQGHVTAQSEVGMCYYTGRGVAQDDKTAVKWLFRAAELGNSSAQRTLGLCYTFGQGVPKDYSEASKWIRQAAEQGLPNAQALLGQCFSSGRGVTQNYQEANEWFRKAAEQGDVTAQTTLAVHYQNGQGITKNLAEAAIWYRRAAKQGYAPAQCGLGDAYLNGVGVPEDHIEAMEWLSEAGNQGYAPAQFKLADCYFMGRGASTDFEEGYKWLCLAAAQRDKDAVAMLDFISPSMSSPQIAEGRRRAAAFTPKKNVYEEKRHL